MHLHTATWGHVGLPGATASIAMESAEEAGEIAMLRCRYDRKFCRKTRVSLGGLFPETQTVIFNPNTLQDLANIFETNIERAFA
jgi:hypothetical protein